MYVQGKVLKFSEQKDIPLAVNNMAVQKKNIQLS